MVQLSFLSYNDCRKEDDEMRITTGMLILNIVLLLAVCAVFGYLIFLVIKALRKYIRSEPIRKEKIVRAKTLGEVLKKHRTECK